MENSSFLIVKCNPSLSILDVEQHPSYEQMELAYHSACEQAGSPINMDDGFVITEDGTMIAMSTPDCGPLQQKINQLHRAYEQLGGCGECDLEAMMDEDGPFSHCGCGTSEDYATRPAQKIQLLRRCGITVERGICLLHSIPLPTTKTSG